MEPDKPEPTDCCGSGCSPCVFEIYEKCLKSWKEGHHSEDTSCRNDLLSEMHFKPFQLIHKEQLTDDVYLYQFQPKMPSNGDSEIYGFLPYGIGQHLIVRCKLNYEIEELKGVDLQSKTVTEDAEIKGSVSHRVITRAYTPISLAKKEKNCCFTIFVRLYSNGIGSEYFRQLQIGNTSYWRGPYGEFNYKPNSFKYILMLCIGTGLAPMIPIIEYIISNYIDETVLHLMYGVKSFDHVILRDRLRQMATFWNFSMEYFFSKHKNENDSVKFGEHFKTKRIDRDSVIEFVRGKDLKKLQVLVCGNKDFTSSIKQIFIDLSIDSKNVFVF